MTGQHPTPTQAAGDRRLGWLLWASTVTALALAVAGVVLPGRWGVGAATGAVGIVVAAPLVRLVWLVGRWARERDWAFVAVAVGLLGVIALGAVLAFLRR